MRAAGEEAEAGRRAQAEDCGAESETSPGALGTTSRLWLAAIAALSTLPMIHRGSIARIEFDGWWHVFIARQEVWSHLWEEIDRDAHPPLYYLLLKAVCQLGSSPLVYRSLSIVAAAAATFALGAAVARTSQLRVIPVLAALAFGFATSTVIVAVEVRSYMLAAMSLLFALTPYLRLVEPGGTVRSRFLFVTWITASFLSHYGILFVYAAMLAAPAALCLLRADYRQAWRLALPWRWRADLATVAPPALVMAAAYAWHMDSYRGPMRHLPDFYYSRGESLLSYVGRNLVREVDLFSPLALSPHGPVVRGLGVLIAAAIPLLLLWLVRRQPARAAVAVLSLAFVILVGVQLAGSIAGKYPFGGSLRHQFFVFPFAVATSFLLIDQLLGRIRSAPRRRLAAAAAACLVLGGVAAQWRRLPIPRQPLFRNELAAFRDAIPEADAVYLDLFSLVAFFSHVHDWQWTFVESLAGGRLQILRVSKGANSFLVLREPRRWQSAPGDPGLYRLLRAGLDAGDASSLAIFRLDQEGFRGVVPTPEERRQRGDALALAAGASGLMARKVVHDGAHLYALLERSVPTSAALEQMGAELAATSGGVIEARPNPLQVCEVPGVGSVTLHWRFPGRAIDIRVGSPGGKLWSSPAGTGSAATGPWVRDGMAFYVQDREGKVPTSAQSTLGIAVVRHTQAGCPGQGLR